MIRRATPDDHPAISRLLEDEGITDGVYDKYDSWVYDSDGIKGFYTLKYIHGLPALAHFCVRQDSRKGKAALWLITHFILWCKDNGFIHAYLHAPKDRPKTQRIIEHYFGVKPYSETDRNYWYFL